METRRVGKGVRAGVMALALGLVMASVFAPAMVLGKEKVPGDKELKALALESLMEFNKSVLAQDFTSFHGYISEIWRGQITPQALKEIFQVFIDGDVDLTPIKNLEPVFDIAPGIDDDGLLAVIGHYPSLPSRTAFMLSYIMEKKAWKLIGINVQVSPPATLVPFEPVLAKLAQETLTDFAGAVKAKDFTAFHKNISTLWRQQITPEELKEIFHQFIEKKLDLTPVAKTDPEIDPGAEIDQDKLLTFSGNVPIKPNPLIFKLQYLLENGKWKLASIDVNM